MSDTETLRIRPYLGLAAVLGTWLVIALYWGQLPERIPIHFNASGEPDGFGARLMILFVPVLSTAMFFGLGLIRRMPPASLNYPVRITEENLPAQHRLAMDLLETIRLWLTVSLGLGVYLQVRAALEEEGGGLSVWYLPLFLGSLALILVPYFIQARRLR